MTTSRKQYVAMNNAYRRDIIDDQADNDNANYQRVVRVLTFALNRWLVAFCSNNPTTATVLVFLRVDVLLKQRGYSTMTLDNASALAMAPTRRIPRGDNDDNG